VHSACHRAPTHERQQKICLNDPGQVSARAAKFSPDSRRIALAHVDGELLVYDLTTARPIKRWRRHAPANDLAFSPDGSRIAIAEHGNAPSCQIIEAGSGKLVRSISLPTLPDGVAWNADGTTLATPCADLKIYLWDADSGIRRATLEGSTSSGLLAAFHP
jgi:WD40 repeat protein